MKKFVLLALCVILALSTIGCGKNTKKEDTSDTTSVTDKADEKQSNEKEDASKNNDTEAEEKSDGVVADVPAETAEPTEAPVIESTEELENIVDEFNNTEDPERKEELRKQIEAFLAQAEAASE